MTGGSLVPESRISSLRLFVKGFPRRFIKFFTPRSYSPRPLFFRHPSSPAVAARPRSSYSAPPARQILGRRSGEAADYNIYTYQASPHLFRHPLPVHPNPKPMDRQGTPTPRGGGLIAPGRGASCLLPSASDGRIPGGISPEARQARNPAFYREEMSYNNYYATYTRFCEYSK